MTTAASAPFKLTDEIRAQIGVESEPWNYEVTTTGIRAFARGVGYVDPVYYDIESARESGYGSLPGPPGYIGTAAYIPGKTDETFSVPFGTGPRPRFGMTHVLDGGTSVLYERPLLAGDVISVTYRILELEVKQSKSLGTFLLVGAESTGRDQTGKIVVRERSQRIFY